MNHFANFMPIAGTLSLFLLLGGCSGNSTVHNEEDHHGHVHDHSHDHDHLPESYAEAMNQLAQYAEAIQEAFTDNQPEEGHNALHEIEHLLEVLPEVAADTDLTREDWQQVKETAEKLAGIYSKLDGLLHNSESADEAADELYSEHADAIQDAIQALKAKTPEAEETHHHHAD